MIEMHIYGIVPDEGPRVRNIAPSLIAEILEGSALIAMWHGDRIRVVPNVWGPGTWMMEAFWQPLRGQ